MFLLNEALLLLVCHFVRTSENVENARICHKYFVVSHCQICLVFQDLLLGGLIGSQAFAHI